MRSFWSDPYLWIHLAGLATLPLWLELCLLGLAVGDPVLPVWLELLLVGGVGIVPILWMQWQRPFNIYCLLVLALKPECLTEEQRKLLSLFTVQRNQFLAVGVAVVLAIALPKLYGIAPIASDITPFGSNRFMGLLVAVIAFLGANLFTQVPVAVLSVLFSREATYTTTLPFATDQIRQRFTLLGLPVNQILPPIVATSPVTVPTAIAKKPFSPIAPPDITQVPRNSDESADDLEDIWEDTEPEIKPDGAPAELLTAEATTEADSASLAAPDLIAGDLATDDSATDDLATEESWLDAPEMDDPAAAEPPNSL